MRKNITVIGELLAMRKEIDDMIDKAVQFAEGDFRASCDVRLMSMKIVRGGYEVRNLVARDRSLSEERRSARGTRKRRTVEKKARTHQSQRPLVTRGLCAKVGDSAAAE